MDEARLRAKLAKVEALLAGATTDGERAAASHAHAQLTARLARLQQEQPAEEFRFAMEDPYSRSLFVALVRRYGLKPYRRKGQRRQTIMVKVPAPFVDQVLMPEFRALADELHEQLREVTTRLVATAVHADTSEEPEEAAPKALTGKS